ncbi:hypothetical protein WJX73_009175 [Symbiochloris irregularis]|uniref:Cullin family profile domain-containing protein n=1 Tax=Symbiochloris irregularis TaxID=706552 RepID=A0AAW1PJ89_9CHLO
MGERKPIELEAGWNYMESGIRKLIRLLEKEPEEQFKPDLYMMLYTTIYNMCTQKPPHDYSEQLYVRYREAFAKYIDERVLKALEAHSDEYLLKELYQRWSNHKVMVRWLSRFFNYLDRYHITRHGLPSLADVGLIQFKDRVYQRQKSNACAAILKAIEREREGDQVDRALLKNVLDIFIEVGMNTMEAYEQDFEAALLTETGEYYRRKAAAWIEEDSCPDYMLKAEERLKAEEGRVSNYLHINSRVKLLFQVETELLAKYEMQLLEKEHSGCAALLRDDKKEDLARLYRLFQRVPKGLDPVAETFKKHVESEGMKLVREATESMEAKKDKDAGKPSKETGGANEHQYIRDVIALHDKYMQYVTECFSNSSIFHKALKEAFEQFCNKQVGGTSSAELMASFCDNLLKKGGSEKLSDDAVEGTLEKVVRLLAYISDKDLFAEFFRKKLARRLLNSNSASDEHERSILSRLKQQCGAQFTSKMEGMVTDLALAREKQQDFERWRNEDDRSVPIDMGVTVLTTGFWPTYKAVDLALPQEMVTCVEHFKEWYEVSNKHRKLTWIYALGICNLTAHFDARTIDLVLSTFQATLLLLFNDAEKLSFTEVKERMNIPDEDVLRLLHSLACAKHKILLKDPPTRNLSKTDSFSVNAKFTSTMRRLKIPLPPVDEKKKVTEDVEKDRRYAIDAAIVRTMKSRKTLNHQQLIMEVVQQLTRMFQPDFRIIKKRIEDLIERDYLERDASNPNLYRYLA